MRCRGRDPHKSRVSRNAHGREFLLHLAKFLEDLERLGRLLGVNATHGETDVDQHPVADAPFNGMVLIDNANQVDLAANSGNVNDTERVRRITDGDDLSWNS